MILVVYLRCKCEVVLKRRWEGAANVGGIYHHACSAEGSSRKRGFRPHQSTTSKQQQFYIIVAALIISVCPVVREHESMSLKHLKMLVVSKWLRSSSKPTGVIQFHKSCLMNFSILQILSNESSLTSQKDCLRTNMSLSMASTILLGMTSPCC